MHLARGFTYKYAWMGATDAMRCDACVRAYIAGSGWVRDRPGGSPLVLAARTRGGSRIINLHACTRSRRKGREGTKESRDSGIRLACVTMRKV